MFCCEEHIELALDMYVDEKEKAPKLEKINEKDELSTTCELCEKQAVYVLED